MLVRASRQHVVRFSRRRVEAGEVESCRSVPVSEMERIMKLQAVILKAMAKKITWIAAAEIAGMNPA